MPGVVRIHGVPLPESPTLARDAHLAFSSSESVVLLSPSSSSSTTTSSSSSSLCAAAAAATTTTAGDSKVFDAPADVSTIGLCAYGWNVASVLMCSVDALNNLWSEDDKGATFCLTCFFKTGHAFSSDGVGGGGCREQSSSSGGRMMMMRSNQTSRGGGGGAVDNSSSSSGDCSNRHSVANCRYFARGGSRLCDRCREPDCLGMSHCRFFASQMVSVNPRDVKFCFTCVRPWPQNSIALGAGVEMRLLCGPGGGGGGALCSRSFPKPRPTLIAMVKFIMEETAAGSQLGRRICIIFCSMFRVQALFPESGDPCDMILRMVRQSPHELVRLWPGMRGLCAATALLTIAMECAKDEIAKASSAGGGGSGGGGGGGANAVTKVCCSIVNGKEGWRETDGDRGGKRVEVNDYLGSGLVLFGEFS